MPVLHFSRNEFEERQKAARRRMADEGFDGLLLFKQESMYYLTGYDSTGYSMFQAMVLTADGRCALLTRPPDRSQAQARSLVEDIRIWHAHESAYPASELRDLLDDQGLRGGKVGVEYHAYGLTGQRLKMVESALDGFCHLADGSDLVRRLRLVKSPAELAYIRKAGSICDRILDISRNECRPGASVKSIMGSMIKEVLDSGGDLTATRWPAGAGEAALYGRYFSGENIVAETDQVVFEPGAAYRHYHACSMYNIIVGKPSERQVRMNAACAEALDACHEELRPGRTVGQIFDVHQKTFSRHGFGQATLSACGYPMGAVYPPTWMESPLVWAGSREVVQAGMTFFLHMILFDRETGTSMCIGETAIVEADGCERVTHVPRTVIANV